MKILILKFNALGDVIRTSYILPGLFEKYDNPVVDWVTSDGAYELLRFNPYIRTLSCPQKGLDFLQRNKYDLVLSLDDEIEVLQILEQSNYIRLIGAYLEGSRRCYDGDSAEWFDMGLLSRFGKKVADQKKLANTREHNQIFADMLGIDIERPYFFNSYLNEDRAQKGFDCSCFNIGINPSAGSRWKNKELAFDEVCNLIEMLSTISVGGKHVCIHLLGGAAEQPRNAEIESTVTVPLMNWGGQNTLLEFAAIVKGCDYLISGDTLALHFAISQQIPSLSYYAPTSAAEIGTFGIGEKVISLTEDYCNYKASADNSTITADRLFEAFERWRVSNS